MMRLLVLLCAGVAIGVPAAAATEQPITPLYAPGGKLPAPRPFVDVPRDYRPYDAVEYLSQLGIIEGYPPEPRRAAPQKAQTAQPASAAGAPEKPRTSLDPRVPVDVPSGHWAYDAVRFLCGPPP